VAACQTRIVARHGAVGCRVYRAAARLRL